MFSPSQFTDEFFPDRRTTCSSLSGTWLLSQSASQPMPALPRLICHSFQDSKLRILLPACCLFNDFRAAPNAH